MAKLSGCCGDVLCVRLRGGDRSSSGLLVVWVVDLSKAAQAWWEPSLCSPGSEGCAEIVHKSLMVNVLQYRKLCFVSLRHTMAWTVKSGLRQQRLHLHHDLLDLLFHLFTLPIQRHNLLPRHSGLRRRRVGLIELAQLKLCFVQKGLRQDLACAFQHLALEQVLPLLF